MEANEKFTVNYTFERKYLMNSKFHLDHFRTPHARQTGRRGHNLL